MSNSKTNNESLTSDKLLHIIKEYLEQPESYYAIMINGDWGCGKTFFINNSLKNEIVSINNPASKKGDNYKYAYISLYGVNNIDEIKEKIYLSIFKWIDNKPSKVVGGILNLSTSFNLGIDADKLVKNIKKLIDNIDTTKYVLVFDDLERLGRNINVSDTLGFINSFVEHDNTKVVIVCNEKEISENVNIVGADSNSNKDGITKYSRVKEKLIGRTIDFEIYTPKEALKIFLGSIKQSYKQYYRFISKYEEFIIELLNRTGPLNLRTYKFSLDILQRIFSEFIIITENNRNIKEGTTNYEIFMKELITFVLSISFDYKNAKLSNITESDFVLFNNFTKDSFEDNITGVQKTLQDYYINYYKALFIKFNYFDSVYKYITKGYLNMHDFKSEVDVNFELLPDHVNTFVNISLFYNLEDLELQKEVDNIIQFIKEGKYSLLDYINIFRYLCLIFDRGLITSVSKNEFEELILENIKKYEDSTIYIPDIEQQGEFIIDNEKADLKKIRIAIIDLNNKLRAKVQKTSSMKVLSNLDTNINKFIVDLRFSLFNDPIFIHIKGIDLFHKVVSLSNFNKQEFYLMLVSRYTKHSEYRLLNSEIETWNAFCDEAKKYLKDKPKTISVIHLERIMDLMSSKLIDLHKPLQILPEGEDISVK